jgi:hypothetical protein
MVFIKIFRKNIIFPKGILLNRVKKSFLDLKSWGPLTNFLIRSRGWPWVAAGGRGWMGWPGVAGVARVAAEFKSRWTVPLIYDK